MKKAAMMCVWAMAATLFFTAVLWIGGFLDVPEALAEYLRFTTVEGLELPKGCIPTNETAPPDLMQIVEAQRRSYDLALQRVAVCRSSRRLIEYEQRRRGLPIDEEGPCRVLYRGCCSCQFQRHVVVAASAPTEGGSILVQASLIQS